MRVLQSLNDSGPFEWQGSKYKIRTYVWENVGEEGSLISDGFAKEKPAHTLRTYANVVASGLKCHCCLHLERKRIEELYSDSSFVLISYVASRGSSSFYYNFPTKWCPIHLLSHLHPVPVRCSACLTLHVTRITSPITNNCLFSSIPFIYLTPTPRELC